MIPAQIFPKFPLGQEKTNSLFSFSVPYKRRNKTFVATNAILIEFAEVRL
jgi:hypothetical protein